MSRDTRANIGIELSGIGGRRGVMGHWSGHGGSRSTRANMGFELSGRGGRGGHGTRKGTWGLSCGV